MCMHSLLHSEERLSLQTHSGSELFSNSGAKHRASGQFSFLGLHIYYFSSFSLLFVLVVDINSELGAIHSLKYWVASIRGITPKSPILLFFTHEDCIALKQKNLSMTQ